MTVKINPLIKEGQHSNEIPITEIKLVSGEFSAEEAKEVMMSLLDAKIHFHCRKNFSLEERFGEKDKDSILRIKQLKTTKEDLKALFHWAKKNNKTFRISSDVSFAMD